MNTQQKNLLYRLEHQLMRLRGCIDAMVMVDDSVPHTDPRYRESASTLHMIMEGDLRTATDTCGEILKAGRRRK